MTYEDIARAFSSHRFEEVFASVAQHATWTLVGQECLTGRDAIIATCRQSAEALREVETSWDRFLSVAAGDVVAVDAVARYTGPEEVAVVSSCDVYEFEQGEITAITSYAVETSSAQDPPAAAG